jgi:hypothetical protein
MVSKSTNYPGFRSFSLIVYGVDVIMSAAYNGAGADLKLYVAPRERLFCGALVALVRLVDVEVVSDST